jgi:hypothetical protein
MIARRLKAAAGMSSLALLGCMLPNLTTAQFGVGGNRRKQGSAASFEELNKLAAERAANSGGGAGAGGLEDMLGNMDLGALMEGLDPDALQELIAEGLKDPKIQEMVSWKNMIPHILLHVLCAF